MSVPESGPAPGPRHQPPRALAAVAVIAVIAWFAGRWLGSGALTLFCKPGPVLAMAIWVARARRDRVGRLVTAGLLASAVGDVLLDLPGAFLAGMGAFAVAHLLYIAAMMAEPAGRRVRLARQIPFLVWVGGLLAWAAPRVGPLGGPFTAYGLLIAAMMGRSAARVGTPARRDELTVLAGAVLFGLSDSLIAISQAGAVIPGRDVLIMALYWAGQALIAAGVIDGTPAHRPEVPVSQPRLGP